MLFKKCTIYNFLSLKYKIKPVYLEESREKNCIVWEIAFEMGKYCSKRRETENIQRTYLPYRLVVCQPLLSLEIVVVEC